MVIYNSEDESLFDINIYKMNEEMLPIRNTDFDAKESEATKLLVKDIIMLATYDTFELTKVMIESATDDLVFKGINDPPSGLKTFFCNYEKQEEINIVFDNEAKGFKVFDEDVDVDHIVDTKAIFVQVTDYDDYQNHPLQVNDPLYQQLIRFGFTPIFRNSKPGGKPSEEMMNYFKNNFFVIKSNEYEYMRIFIKKRVDLPNIKKLVKEIVAKRKRKLKTIKKKQNSKAIAYRKQHNTIVMNKKKA